MTSDSSDQPALDRALATASGLKAGSWESARALVWLARAEREAGVR